MAEAIADHLKQILDQIETLKTRYGLSQAVKLIAVSKTFGAHAVKEAYEAGQILFGENKVQEAQEKIGVLSHLPLEWHLIGHLQSNKAKRAAEIFSRIHSVDSFKLAEKLSQSATAFNKTLPILLQVNTSEESSKEGFLPDSALLTEEVHRIAALPGLKLDGLMTIGPLSEQERDIRQAFERLRHLRDQIETSLPALKLPELSMGMSGDFPLALQEGATYLRVGSLIFGRRHTP